MQEEIHDEFVRRLAERPPRIVIGPGQLPDSQMGPVQSAQQHDKILSLIAAGVKEGARLVYGGGRPDGERYRNGYWLQPTLLADVHADMLIAKGRFSARSLPWNASTTRPRRCVSPTARHTAWRRRCGRGIWSAPAA